MSLRPDRTLPAAPPLPTHSVVIGGRALPQLVPAQGPEEGPGGTVAVVDPLSRKLFIPRHLTEHTLAMCRAGTPSLCLLHLTGRCRQGPQCHQIHADPAFVTARREEANQRPSCCAAHGDEASATALGLWADRELVINEVVIPLRSMAFTAGLGRLLRGKLKHAGVVLPSDAGSEKPQGPEAGRFRLATAHLVCRLHVAGHCRYAEDCKFIHVCRDVCTERLAESVQPLVSPLELRHQGGLETSVTTVDTAERPASPQVPALAHSAPDDDLRLDTKFVAVEPPLPPALPAPPVPQPGPLLNSPVPPWQTAPMFVMPGSQPAPLPMPQQLPQQIGQLGQPAGPGMPLQSVMAPQLVFLPGQAPAGWAFPPGQPLPGQPFPPGVVLAGPQSLPAPAPAPPAAAAPAALQPPLMVGPPFMYYAPPQ